MSLSTSPGRDDVSPEGHPGAAVLAVDGGNSKTDVVLVAADGSLIAGSRGPGSSHQRLGMDGAMAALRTCIAPMREPAEANGGPLAQVGVFCLAGVDLPVDDRHVGDALSLQGFASAIRLYNDTFAVLRAGSTPNWGVAVTCGTGLNCVGAHPDGRRVGFPSIGEFSGDFVAGGRWLGVTALGKAVRSQDGRSPGTALETAVPAHFGMPTPIALAEALYTKSVPERRLVELAPVVFQTAALGDDVARSLIDALGREIVTLVTAALRRLRLADLAVPVVLGGAILRAGDQRLLDQVREGVTAVAPKAEIRVLATPPVLGAALMGLDELGAPEAAHTRLRSQLTDAYLADDSPEAGSPP